MPVNFKSADLQVVNNKSLLLIADKLSAIILFNLDDYY